LFGFCGVSFWSVLEEAALVFGLAHLRFTQNVARPNTSTTSSSTTILVLAPPLTTILFLGGGGVWGVSEVLSQAKMSVSPYPAAALQAVLINATHCNATHQQRSLE
jgi:hypothetical protein